MALTIATDTELDSVVSKSISSLEYFTNPTNAVNNKSDVTLVVENKRFFCHRLLLSLISPVFTRMFEGEFLERNAREIELDGKKADTILELLQYAYPQFSGCVNAQNVEDFLLLADEYMIEHLKEPCKEVLLKELDIYQHVSLPMDHRLEKPSMKAKNFHASDSALDSTQLHDDQHPVNQTPLFPFRIRNRANSPRLASQKPSSATNLRLDSKDNAKSKSPRYILFLNQNQIPTFHDRKNQTVPFRAEEVELWISRLRLLYQIDRAQIYNKVIDSIIAVLQFLPTAMLTTLAKITPETLVIDEMMLNDIARARVYMLEEWSTDGEFYRRVHLADSYKSIKSVVLAQNVEQTAAATQLEINPSSVRVEPIHNETEDSDTDSDS